jgi:hypothetical protein
MQIAGKACILGRNGLQAAGLGVLAVLVSA